MTARRRVLLAVALVVAAALHFAPAPAQSDVSAQVLLGNCVRAGRPLGVRVSGGAAAVRADGTPWALPQGAEGDEFLLDGVRPSGDRLTLFVRRDRDGPEITVDVPVRELPELGEIVAVLDGSETGDAEVGVRPGAGLPTIAAAWLVFDGVRGVPDGVAPVQRHASGVDRRGPQPLLLATSPLHFRAADEARRRAPTLPRDVGLLLVILAVAEGLLVALVRSRAGSIRLASRVAWLGGPPLAALAFLVLGARLPGPVLTTVAVVGTDEGRLVVVRLEARRPGSTRLVLPESASQPALLRFGPGDGSEGGMWTGRREVRAELPAGATRLVAYTVPPAPDGSGPDGSGPDGSGAGQEPGPETVRWLGSLGRAGRVATGEDRAALFRDALPSGRGSRVVPALGLRTR